MSPLPAATPAASPASGDLLIAGPCPNCRGVIDLEGPPFPPGFHCEACGKVFESPPSATLQQGRTPDRCLFCGDTDFYVEKDMPRGLGLSLVVMAAVLVPWTYGLSILVVAFFQIPFFLLLPMRHVCYGCQALYRRFPTDSRSRPFDHELATMRELRREKLERLSPPPGSSPGPDKESPPAGGGAPV